LAGDRGDEEGENDEHACAQGQRHGGNPSSEIETV
jgi:hypothetical protein